MEPAKPGKTVEITVQGMTCASCVGRIEKAVRGVARAVTVNVNLATERASVSFSSADANPQAVVAAIREVGYKPMPSTVELKVSGMTCASFIARVEKALINTARAASRLMYPDCQSERCLPTTPPKKLVPATTGRGTLIAGSRCGPGWVRALSSPETYGRISCER